MTVLVLGLAVADRLAPPDMSRLDTLSTIVLAQDGRPLSILPAADGRFRLRTTPDQVDPTYLRMLIAAEDKRFHTHVGVDPVAMGRALGQWLWSGRIRSGGSTITMQVARLLEPRPRTVSAKLRQVVRALQLELHHGKRDILGMYLTLAPFGGNLEGIRMASLGYFEREPQMLNPGQAALLAALPRSPETMRPDRHPAEARQGVRRLMARLVHQEAVSEELAASALAEPSPAARHAYRLAPHLARRLALGGMREVHSTLSAPLQERLETLARQEAAWQGGEAGVAILVAEISSRRVLAWVGNSGLDQPHGYVDMIRRPRSPGSTLKPFIYAMGFDRHLIHPETLVEDRPTRFSGYMPRNFDREYQGQVTIREALIASLNMPAVAVLNRLGPDRFRAAMETAGLRLRLPPGTDSSGLAIALGGVGVSLRDLVTGYAALASDGVVRPLVEIAGQEPPPGRSLVGAESAAAISTILADAPRPPQVAAAGSDLRQAAFKTGTSYGFRDAWAIGWTARHVVGIWVGRADGSPRPGAMGRTAAAPILFRTLDMLERPGRRPQTPAERPATALLDRKAPRSLTTLTVGGEEGRRGPSIVFPVANGIIETPRRVSQTLPPIPLEASGGHPPYRWYVDGVPLPPRQIGHSAQWHPNGEGFVHLTVVDADGRSASMTTRLQVGPNP